jgi:hypothetical protein
VFEFLRDLAHASDERGVPGTRNGVAKGLAFLHPIQHDVLSKSPGATAAR